MADEEIKKKKGFGLNLAINRDEQIYKDNAIQIGDAYAVIDSTVGAVQVSGFSAHAAVLEGTIDGTNYIVLTLRGADGVEVSNLNANGLYNFTERLPLTRIRVNQTGTGSGDLTVHAIAKTY